MRDARVIIATEQRWPAVNEAWIVALEHSEMKVVREFELEAPKVLERPILCWELKIMG